MRSPADVRRLAEWVLRAAVVGALAIALWRSTRDAAEPRAHLSASHAGLARELARATRDARVASLDVTLDSAPAPAVREWLASLRRAGVDMRWRGTLAPLALEAVPSREPAGGVQLLLAGGPGTVSLRDSAGALDSVRLGASGAALSVHGVVGAVYAAAGATRASVTVPRERSRRAVLVLGRADWESRFVAAALQESGWTVRARIPIAPGVAVTDPGLLPIDTARYDVAVALDSTAADLAPALARFAASGGGLVLVGGGNALAPLRAYAAATAGARRPGRILLDGDSVTRADLPVRPLDAIGRDAVRLEGTPAASTVAVRRAGRARVVAIGYDESWRWRMLGGESGLAAHRAWWSRTVALAAPSADTLAAAASADPAPLAALVDALGAPSAPTAAHRDDTSDPLTLWLFALLGAALLAEIASRRFRGAS